MADMLEYQKAVKLADQKAPKWVDAMENELDLLQVYRSVEVTDDNQVCCLVFVKEKQQVVQQVFQMVELKGMHVVVKLVSTMENCQEILWEKQSD